MKQPQRFVKTHVSNPATLSHLQTEGTSHLHKSLYGRSNGINVWRMGLDQKKHCNLSPIVEYSQESNSYLRQIRFIGMRLIFKRFYCLVHSKSPVRRIMSCLEGWRHGLELNFAGVVACDCEDFCQLNNAFKSPHANRLIRSVFWINYGGNYRLPRDFVFGSKLLGFSQEGFVKVLYELPQGSDLIAC